MSDLRAQFLKVNPFRSRLVTVTVPQNEGEEPLKLTVKVKQPSVAERNAIFSDTRVSKSGEVNTSDGARTGARAIVICCRHPDTDEPVFTLEDLDVLMNTPAGGWVDSLAAEVMKVLSEAQENAKK